ncbi:MAG TPA: OST-HTH/LOTUS domain-containing protein, partial [Azonexus sp.]|nr:OST-HTH/LOTUS domain-containing protein [Azonexus sp.]
MAIPNGSSKPTFEARLYRFGKLSDLVRSKPRVFTVEEREVARHEIQSYLRSPQGSNNREHIAIMAASSTPRQDRQQTEMLNEGIEIAVAVEQGVTIFDATRRNQRV